MIYRQIYKSRQDAKGKRKKKMKMERGTDTQEGSVMPSILLPRVLDSKPSMIMCP